MYRENICVCIDVAPINNKSGGLWLRWKIEDGASRRRKNSRREIGVESSPRRWEEVDIWHLNTGHQPHGGRGLNTWLSKLGSRQRRA